MIRVIFLLNPSEYYIHLLFFFVVFRLCLGGGSKLANKGEDKNPAAASVGLIL